MKLGYFITGTDTGVGKTLIASALLYQFGRQGLASVGMKPISAGLIESATGWINEDVESLRRAGNVAVTAAEICPYLLPAAIAPHIAAAEASVTIELAVIKDRFQALTKRADAVVVEGVGGFRVPLNSRRDTADLAAMLGLPIILVVGMRLGCLNHALLTAEAIHSRCLILAGWVANQIDSKMPRLEENIAALTERLPCPLIARVPFFAAPVPRLIELKLPQ